MNRLSRISDNVLDKKTDYSDLVKAENENPLKPGQTQDFRGMLEMQMQRGRSNAARVMKPEQNEQVQPERAAASENEQMNVQTAAFDGNSAGSDISNFRMQQAINAYEMFMTA